MIEDAELAKVASLCSRVVYTWAGPTGFDAEELRRRLPRLDALTDGERFRVFTMLAKSEYIATVANGWGGWRFWARHFAPEGAYRAVR